jgi:hypothetical protein
LATEDEIKTKWPNDWQEFWDESKGGYTVGMDMFRILHCVISWQLRKPILTGNRLIGSESTSA